jgi:hypothetical protein
MIDHMVAKTHESPQEINEDEESHREAAEPKKLR